MPIPKSREQLVEMIESSFERLDRELSGAGLEIGGLHCVDDWAVKDLLAVRAWWAASVVEWIEAGKKGARFDLPAPGYGWQETPRLNDDIVREARPETYEEVLSRLRTGYRRVLTTIAALSDEELLRPGAYEWAGKWPLARWISINTARQYATARTFVRRARTRSLDRKDPTAR